jgi:hypothetical protein
LIKGKEHRTAEQLLSGIPDTVASQGFDKEGEPKVKDFVKIDKNSTTSAVNWELVDQ